MFLFVFLFYFFIYPALIRQPAVPHAARGALIFPRASAHQDV